VVSVHDQLASYAGSLALLVLLDSAVLCASFGRGETGTRRDIVSGRIGELIERGGLLIMSMTVGV
jgi:hypothetical protein